MNNLDYIKSYMIKLGVDLDNRSISKYESFASKTDRDITKLFSKFAGYALKIDTIFNTIIIGAYKFGSSVARSDLEVQKLSRHLYMSRDSAKAFKDTLDAMDLSMSDLRDIALNSELSSQYKELINLSQSMGTPAQVKESLKEIRSLSFEFQKLQVIFSRFIERVVHFIYRSMRGPARSFRQFLQDFNSKFAKNITNWAERLGNLVGIILRTIMKWKDFLSLVSSLIGKIWGSLSGITKGIILAIGTISTLIRRGPLGRLLSIITGLLILTEDYQGYKKGLESSETLKPLWGRLDDQLDNPDSPLNKLGNSLEEFGKTISKAIEDLKNWYDELDIVESLWELWESIKNWYDNNPLIKWLKEKLGIDSTDGIRKQPSPKFYNQSVTPPPGWDPLNELPTNPWTIEGQNRLKYLASKAEYGAIQRSYDDKGMKALFGELPTNPWAVRDTGTQTMMPYAQTREINQTFNFNIDGRGMNDPEDIMKRVSRLIRNAQTPLVY